MGSNQGYLLKSFLLYQISLTWSKMYHCIFNIEMKHCGVERSSCPFCTIISVVNLGWSHDNLFTLFSAESKKKRFAVEFFNEITQLSLNWSMY